MKNHKPVIAHIISNLNVGGAERMLANLVLNMDRTKFNNVVISLQDLGYWGKKLQDQGIEVHALHMSSNVFGALKFYSLWRLLRKIKPDILQGWMYHANVIALIVGKLAGIKYIYWNIRCSLMDLSNYKFTTKLMFKLGALLSGFASLIINNSKVSMLQHNSEGYCINNSIHIPNGFDTELFKPDADVYKQFRLQHNLPSNAILIGIVARFDAMKDHATFLRAAGILAEQRQDVYFICAGRSIDKNNTILNDIIGKNNIEDRVLLLGQIHEVHSLYPALDYLTQTSIFGEGFPNVVAEAMACGVECFITDVGDSVELVGDMGYTINPKQPAELAIRWLQIINEKTNKLNPRQRIIDNFSLATIVDIYSRYYTRTLT